VPNEEMRGRILPQPPDVAANVIMIAVAGFLGLLVLTMIGAYFFLKAGAPGALKPKVEHTFPEPVLQKSPQADLKRLESEQRMALSAYAWVDRSQGLVRIPVEEAMGIIAARGEHAYDPLGPATAASNNKPIEGRP
jgi:hypothetical protein